MQKKKHNQQIIKKVYKKQSGSFFGIPTNALITGGVSISLVASLILIWKVFFSGSKENGKQDVNNHKQESPPQLIQSGQQTLPTGSPPQPIVLTKDQFKNMQDGQDHNLIRNRIRNGQIGNFKVPSNNTSSAIANNVATINRRAASSDVMSNTPPSLSGKEMNANDRNHSIPAYGDDYYSQINQVSSHLPKINVQDIDPHSGIKPTPRI